MKVTVTFGDTSVVVPCKDGWTVRDLSEQATRRYRRILEQRGETPMQTHHLEYVEGGILDMDDDLSDLVEDRDKLVAVFHKAQHGRTESPREIMSNGSSSAAPSPEPFTYYPHLQYHDENRGEIEVNEAILKANTPLMVRSSSDSALAPPTEMTPPPENQSNGTPDLEISNVLKGALDRLAEDPPAKMSKVNFSTLTRTVEFPGDSRPLGIHVVPYCSSLNGRPLGLHIKGIEENSRSKKENLFREDECIVQINETPLQDKTFAQSQEVFRQAMGSSSVRVDVLPTANKSRYEKSFIGQLFTGDSKDSSAKASPVVARAKVDPQPDLRMNTRADMRRPDAHSKTPEPTVPNMQPAELQPAHGSLERASPTFTAKGGSSSPTTWTRSESPLASKSPAAPSLANLTNRKGGKKLKIDLKKGSEGLGFTVVTRDSSVQGPGPILVKSILQRGAAVKDGRLQPGDRILEVNGVDMTGRSQEELVAMLRSTKQGESVSLVVARQEDIFLPRELKSEGPGVRVMEDGREQLMYEIPLNETGSAGLGVSLKGNKSRETGEDLGIFIKSIIHGGAAYKDGRLCINDQMIAVNGESLLGRSNHAAMETLRRSMSSEGNTRGTIQVVVLRTPRQMGNANSAPAADVSTNHRANIQSGSGNQDPRSHDSHQRPSGPSRAPESTMNSASHTPAMTNNYTYGKSGSAPSPAAAAGDSHGHYGNNNEEQDFPPPPSPNTVEQMNRDLSPTPPSHSELQKVSPAARAFYAENAKDNVPRNRASKSMDMVADESNVGSLVGQKNKPSEEGTLGPTLGLMKSSSLESLQTAMSEVKQNHIQAQVPFHRPRPHMVRGRGCNQSFRIAIDKSYDGPSEDDDDLSDHSSGHETPASSSSRQDLDADDGKKKDKKKKKDVKKKKEKKTKGGKKSEDSAEDTEKKTKRKGFGLIRFGKKKDDKSKDVAKASKGKLEALSEEELDRIPDDRDGYDPRYAEVQSGHVTPDPSSIPDVEDDDGDPNYARINNFRQPPSPQSFVTRTPSPAVPAGGTSLQQPSFEDLDGLYAKVNKSRAPPASQNQHQTQAESDQRLHGLRREYMQARAAPGYEELDAARRRILEYDPNRMAPRGTEPRSNHHYEEIDRQYLTQPRRDPYDYPTHSRPVPRDSGPNHYHDAPGASHSGRLPDAQSSTQSQHPLSNPRYYPSAQTGQQQHRAAARQDVPPSPTTGHRGRQPYDSGGRRDGYRQASPGRYTSPERHPADRERYNSPDRYRYGDERQPDPRRKNPMIGAV